ncbi:MAG: Tol-Pal system beta propeller repeat protein TolB [Acidobacteriota bacterium]
MRFFRRLFPVFFLVSVAWCLPLRAQEEPDLELQITGTGFQKIPLALPPFPTVSSGELAASAARGIHQVMQADLDFSGYFDLVDPDLFELIPAFSERDVRFRDWLSIGAQAVFLGKLQIKGQDLAVEGRLYDTSHAADPSAGGGHLIFGKRYQGDPELDRRIGHKLANDVVHFLTGSDGVFLTKIAFTAQLGPGRKEIFVMDYDGQRRVQITNNGSINLSPTWSVDGSRLAYVSFASGKPEIHTIDATGRRGRVFAREGDLNSAPEWSPDGRSMIYSVSRNGNSEIVSIDLATSRIRRLTHHPAIDTSPVYSPTAREIAFTSDRSGSPQIYIMEADGANVRRVTSTGSYNDSAAWSPRGNLLVYVSRVEGRFELVLLDISSGVKRYLTRGTGNNENPRFSPDGMHLVFSSNRGGSYQIFTMDLTGGHVRRLTQMGASETPDWSR